jgi:hypothetical protein
VLSGAGGAGDRSGLEQGWSAVIAWSNVVTWLTQVPPGVWVAAMVANIVLTAATWSTARRRVRRPGQRVADPGRAPGEKRAKDAALTVASLVPAGLFWVMVLAGSFHGLVAFGRSTLGWRNGWEYLVPGTLDGVSVTFAMLAFRAVRKGKTPDRCYRVVWGAAMASATINFSYEYGQSGNALAGGYVGLLSLFGMFMFDEFLNQFEDSVDNVRRQNPKFGVRWLTWPSNTLLAAIAWRNHPPDEGTPGTVANAVTNLNRVRAAKRDARCAERRQGAPVPGFPAADAMGRDRAAPAPTGSALAATHRPPQPRQVNPRAGRGRPARENEVKVPSSSATVMQWARIWVAMCQRPDMVAAALQDDGAAREHFDVSSRQLRQIRYAVSTGALRRRAQELHAVLPDEFTESPPTEA